MKFFVGQQVLARGDCDPRWIKGTIVYVDTSSIKVTREDTHRWYSISTYDELPWDISWVKPCVLKDSLTNEGDNGQ